MEITKETWYGTTKSIYTGVLLYAVGGLISAILSPILALIVAGSTISSFASGSASTAVAGMGIAALIGLAVAVIIIVGYVLYLKGLLNFKKILVGEDAAAVGKITTGVILNIIAAVVKLIPFLGWIGTILFIIGFVMMLLGFMALKDSRTFPVTARKGASTLFIAMLLQVLALLLGFIPFIGGFIALVIGIIVFFMTLSGWASIKNADPAEV